MSSKPLGKFAFDVGQVYDVVDIITGGIARYTVMEIEIGSRTDYVFFDAEIPKGAPPTRLRMPIYGTGSYTYQDISGDPYYPENNPLSVSMVQLVYLTTESGEEYKLFANAKAV